jgi:hypothetical protein
MNYTYTYNNYSLFNQNTPTLIASKNNNNVVISPQMVINDGNINNVKKINGDTYSYPKSVNQYYNQKYCKLPIYPLENNNNGLEKWEKKQPLKFNNNTLTNNSQFPIDQLDSYKILDSYDHNNMFSHHFFYQKDGRLSNYN